MSTTPDSTLVNPEQLIADLQRQLAECRAERDEAQRQLAEKTIERNEALAQQTATAEVLQVINSSPGDLTSVFDAVLEKATRLCEASFGVLGRFDGERFHTLALHGVSGSIADVMREPVIPQPGSGSHRLVIGERIVHIRDITDTTAYRAGVASRRMLADVGGARTALWVALHKDGALLGNFVVYRR
jgi:hypothetical protein